MVVFGCDEDEGVCGIYLFVLGEGVWFVVLLCYGMYGFVYEGKV